MCTVSINIDEAALREMRPELDGTAAVRLWVQELVDARMRQMRAEKRLQTPQKDLWHAIEQDQELTIKPSMVVTDEGEAVDLETFRADLHSMVEKIYAEA